MKEKIVQITHSTGKYTLNILPGRLNEMQEQIDRCLNNEQAAIVIRKDNGDQLIYPSELLKNSFITIVDKIIPEVL